MMDPFDDFIQSVFILYLLVSTSICSMFSIFSFSLIYSICFISISTFDLFHSTLFHWFRAFCSLDADESVCSSIYLLIHYSFIISDLHLSVNIFNSFQIVYQIIYQYFLFVLIIINT